MRFWSTNKIAILLQSNMRILSLFDGMSCGMLAMIVSGVPVDEYVAYEIDKYAIPCN